MQTAFTQGMESVAKDKPGNVGTHSLRKMAATYARANGCSKASFFTILLSLSLAINPLSSLFFYIRMMLITAADGRIPDV